MSHLIVLEVHQMYLDHQLAVEIYQTILKRIDLLTNLQSRKTHQVAGQESHLLVASNRPIIVIEAMIVESREETASSHLICRRQAIE